MAEIHSLSGLNDEEGRQLRITVASLRQQLGFERQQRARTSKEIAELRSHSSSSSRAGQALQQQVARLRKERADLDKKHQHTIATLQKKLKQVNKRLSEQRDAAAAEAAAAATAASNAVAEPTARAAELQEQAAKLQAELNAAVASSRETAAAIMAAEAARDAACGRAAVAESAVAELQAQLAHAVADKERGLEVAQRQSAAAGRVTEDLRQELESVRQDGRQLQLKVEGIAALEAQLHSAEQGQAAAQAQAAAREDEAAASMKRASGELGRLGLELEEATAALKTSQAQQSELEAQVLDLTEQAEAAASTAARVQQELQAAEAASTTRSARADALELQLRAEIVAAGGEIAGVQSRLDEAQAEARETAQRLESVEGALRVAEAGRRVSADAAEAVREELRGAEDVGAALGRVAGLLLMALHATETRYAASEARASALNQRLEAADEHLTCMHDAVSSQEDGSEGPAQALAGVVAAADVPEAAVRVQADLQELVQARSVLCGKVEALQDRCAQLGATNEELRLSNQGLLFEVDSHGALIMELKNKLTAIPESGTEAVNDAVAQWLGGIRPALDDAVEDIQEKKAFLENAAQLCETLKSDVSALRQLSEDTLSDVEPEVTNALAQAVEEHEALRADLEAARREHDAAAAMSHSAVAAAEAARASALDAAAEAAAQFEEARVELAAVEAERQQLRTELQEQIKQGEQRALALQADVEAAEAQGEEAARRARCDAAAACDQLEALQDAYASLDTMRGTLQEQLELSQEQLCEERARVSELEDELAHVRREASVTASELLEPGIDVIVAKLQEAEAQNTTLQQQLRQAEAADAGAAESRAAVQLRAEVEHLKATNGNLRAQNRGLKSDVHHSATTQDQLRGDVARLMRQIEDLRGASAAADAGDTARAQPDPAAGDMAQQRAVREAVEAIAQRLRDDGAAADSAHVVRTQADRIVNQSQTIEDLNDLLSKRQRDVRRMRVQIDSIARVPEQGMTLPQLAAKAALAGCLQQQLDSAVARNEALQRGARSSDTKRGFNGGARRQLQTLARAFGMGSVFGDSIDTGTSTVAQSVENNDKADGDTEEQMRRQSGLEIDLQSGTISARSAIMSE